MTKLSVERVSESRCFTRLPTDPVTGEAYGYRTIGMRQFEVCATFDRPSRPEDAGDFWFHEAGRRCFTLDLRERPD